MMVDCRYCRDSFRKPVETIGARCPTCRMPLFEKEKQRPPVVDLGFCSLHKDNSAVAKCQRCGRMMCSVCRTRWDEEIVCPGCLDLSLQKGDMTPRQEQMQNRAAVWSLLMALGGWFFLLLTFWPLSNLFKGTPERSPANFAGILLVLGALFAVVAIGQAAACIRIRGKRLAIATWGLSLAGLHLGLCLGILFLNIWHH